jgi:hypothetical protein
MIHYFTVTLNDGKYLGDTVVVDINFLLLMLNLNKLLFLNYNNSFIIQFILYSFFCIQLK